MDTLQGLILERAKNEAQEASIKAVVAGYPLLPHMRYGCRIFYDGLEWVCMFGSGDQAVVGRGESPREATMNFDSAWNGTE